MKAWLSAFLVCCILGCRELPPADGEGDLLVVCTTAMVGDAVKAMLGPGCEVQVLMGPGTDPHLFKPTKESLDLLSRAGVVVANGLHLEGRMHDVLEKMARSRVVVFASDGVGGELLLYADAHMRTPDPHLWFDVSIWRQACTHISHALEQALPGCYRPDGASAYLARLDSLHIEVQRGIRSISPQRRVLVTAHDAFGYFGRAYEVEVLALQGISTVAEYGVRDVARLVDLISERRIPAIFAESSISPRSIEAVVAGCMRKGWPVKLGGTLYSDAPGPPGSGTDTYEGMVRHNLYTIKEALQ